MNIKTIKTAYKIHRFERRHQKNVHQQLEDLTDRTFIERISEPEDREMVLTKKGRTISRKLAYNRKREFIQ